VTPATVLRVNKSIEEKLKEKWHKKNNSNNRKKKEKRIAKTTIRNRRSEPTVIIIGRPPPTPIPLTPIRILEKEGEKERHHQ